MFSFIDYIFPNRCVGCQRILNNRISLCIECMNELPFSHEKINRENITSKSLLNHSNLEGAACLLRYKYGNLAQKLIHANKYYNQPHIGVFLAELSKAKLKDLNVDIVTCIPTHSKTKRNRGYNQVEAFAKEIADFLEVEFDANLIKRKKRRDSQTHRNKIERTKSLKGAFVIDDDVKEYNSILLLDDVLTTGATLNECLFELSIKTNATVNVFTMARVV